MLQIEVYESFGAKRTLYLEVFLTLICRLSPTFL